MISLLATDPSRYRCSPERMKKAWSSQDEVSAHVRQGRRQSGKVWCYMDKNLLYRMLARGWDHLQQYSVTSLSSEDWRG